VALRAAPHLAFGPEAQFAQLEHLQMRLRRAADHRQFGRVEDLHLGAEVLEDASRFFSQEAAERALAQ
jgi:hypothetical protein